MERSIITIDQEKCNGCGLCIPNCPEGAIQIIDNKARLVSDLMCDGLGACLGHCPQGAISVIKREAEAYDERKVMANIVLQGPNTIKAHLIHLRDHNQTDFLSTAVSYLSEKGIDNPLLKETNMQTPHTGCPGSRTMSFENAPTASGDGQTGDTQSRLTHWPVQMHLISPQAPAYQNADVLIAADCTAYAAGDFHTKFLKGKALAIACPKLDDGQNVYVEKITALIDEANINTLTVMIMQVPCCGGLLRLAQQGVAAAKRKIPLKSIVICLQGTVLKEEWL
jgi:NAD-dependent dihydropyrimidine dehydrogenase PreA subunit